MVLETYEHISPLYKYLSLFQRKGGDDDEDEDGEDGGDSPKGDEELGSDLDDDSEDDEPDTEHIILCQYEKVCSAPVVSIFLSPPGYKS